MQLDHLNLLIYTVNIITSGLERLDISASGYLRDDVAQPLWVDEVEVLEL